MRLAKNIPHPRYLISVFRNADNFLLQVEDGPVRVSYKLASYDFNLATIEALFGDAEFVAGIENALQTLRKHFPREDDLTHPDDDII